MKIALEHIASLQGHRPLLMNGDYLLTVRLNKLYLYNHVKGKLQVAAALNMTVIDRIIASSCLLRRMFRFGIHCGYQIDSSNYVVACKERIYRVNAATSEITREKTNRQGFKPLIFTTISGLSEFDEHICYGEYGSNRRRSAIEILGREKSGEWHTLYTFPPDKIDHVHSLVPDPYRECVWILTGDYDKAAAIWMAKDNFKTVKCIVRGRQIYRASVGYAVHEGLLYATDSHLGNNSIRLLHPYGGGWISKSLYP